MRISIVLIERTVPAIRELMDAVAKEFNASVSRDMIDLGATHAYQKKRGQYDAEVLLSEISRFRSLVDKTLFIFREDLFVENMNYIFGLAAGDVCIISTTRLDPRFYGEVKDIEKAQELFRERLIKEALHELGHTFGLPHCENKKCVMVFSNSIEGVDSKGMGFCDGCKKVLEHIIKEYG